MNRAGKHVLVVNCGSATVKTRLFRMDPGGPAEIAAVSLEVTTAYGEIVARALGTSPVAPDAIAHRVVHGGERFTRSVRVTEDTLAELRAVTPLAPIHNASALAGIEATLGAGVPLVAAFDTEFHRTLPEVAWRYAVPADAGVRRYGFHGWSHRSVTEQYARLTGRAEPTIVTLHLGGGCSAAAIRRGQSVDTSMGYSPLEGLVMGTRPGDLDPGVLTHLLLEGLPPERLEDMLNHESGLLALGGTADMRRLLQRDDAAAVLAVELFCYRARKYVGAYLAVLEGAEAIVFTGGIGERSAEIRRRICEPLGWAGLRLDPARNRSGGPRVSTDDSLLAVWVLPADEERLIATEAAGVLGWD